MAAKEFYLNNLSEQQLIQRKAKILFKHGDKRMHRMEEDFKEIQSINLILEKMHSPSFLSFTFSKDIRIIDIQNFAMLVIQILKGEFNLKNIDYLKIIFPDGITNYEMLINTCKDHIYDFNFNINTPSYKGITYPIDYLNEPTIVPSLNLILNLSACQRLFIKLINKEPHDIMYDYKIYHDFSWYFISTNNEILRYFSEEDIDNNTLEWNKKYSPCFIDLDRMRKIDNLIRIMFFDSYFSRRDKDIQSKYILCRKYILQGFAYQCRYLTLWSCLVTIDSFPMLDGNTKEVLSELINFLIEKYTNLYVFDITKESNTIELKSIEKRKSEANTTRIKIYFCESNANPKVIRLDLPHINHPYVHLNIEPEDSDNHRDISKEAKAHEFDHVFDELEYALLNFDYMSTECIHSKKIDDKEILDMIPYRMAMIDFAMEVFDSTVLRNTPSKNEQIGNSESSLLLKEFLFKENFTTNEISNFSPYEILALCDAELSRNKL